MLKLVYGVSGAGKTSYILEQIKKDVKAGIRCVLLVPEQQAYISERDLPAHLPKNAGLYFEILHFSGLADDVFHAYGGVNDRHTSTDVRALLMWNTLRTLSPMLKSYRGGARTDASLSARMLATADELYAAGIESNALEHAAATLPEDHPLRAKLEDLALVCAAFRAEGERLGAEDLSDKLIRLEEMLGKHSYFEGHHVYVDSFAGFTARELAVLRRIMEQAEAVTVTLCTDRLLSRAPHFEGVSETAKQLHRTARTLDLEIEEIPLAAKGNRKPPSLQALADGLWNFSAPPPKDLPPEDSAVRLIKCANMYEEAECTALRILEMVRDGLHYGEIAVVMRDAETYRGVLDAALERHGIPFFLSERTDLSSTPLSRLLLCALRAVSNRYRASDVIGLLKTGLVGVAPRDAALFEEYCSTWHITGRRFCDPLWSMNPDGLTAERSPRAEEILEAANRVRACLMKPLELLRAELQVSELLPDRCRALYHYLCRLHVSEQLAERASEELARGMRREAGETLRLYGFTVDTLTLLSSLLPDARMNTEELARALELLFSGSDMGSVPQSHDCVILGSASTLRIENVKASILLGLCEGEFPLAVTDDGILTEGDKEHLSSLGLHLDSGMKRRTADELLYVYRAVTKPSRHLLLSTVAADTDGSLRTPSIVFYRAALLLGLTPESFDFKALQNAEEEGSSAPPLIAPPLPAGTKLRLSQSKLNAFALCPYRYYCTYRLKLREEKDSTATYADDGVFLHAVLEGFLRASVTEKGEMHFPTEEERIALVDDIIDRYINEVCPMPKEWMDNRLLHLFSRLRGMALLILRELCEELSVGKFVPTYFEERIGDPRPGKIPPVSIALTDGSEILLSGVIDRIDLYREGEKVYVRVVDYKTSEHKFDLSKVRTGEDVQLILYLHALLSADRERYYAAGAQFLYTVSEDGVRRVVRHGLVLDEEQILEAMDSTAEKIYVGPGSLKKMPGEQIELLIREMREAVAAIGRRILDGEAQKTPSEEACRYCPVATHCDRAVRDR